MRKLAVGILAGALAGTGLLDGRAGEADVAWRKLAYPHGLRADAAGVCRTEVNLSRGDVRNIAPLKLEWPAAPGCAYSAEFNGKAYAVSVESGVCSFQVPDGAFKRDRNLVALGVRSGVDAALTNADRVLAGTMEECGVSHTFAGGKIDWQFNPTWNGYREWVWHLSALRFLDEMVRQYVLDGNEAYALGKVEQELEQQVYPDGQQVELSTGYHPGVIGLFSRVPRMCAHAGVKPPENVHAVLARMYEPYMAIMRPDGRIPALNDATIWPSRAFFGRGLRDFPERTDFAWFAGKEGAAPPAWTSRALPYAGWVALRDSWDRDAVWGFMDCGPYGTGHQHEDKLNVLVCAFGRELVNEGGWYDYDTSENRRYILSTRSHNTVRFDGRDQATGSVYRWHPKTDCRKRADFLFATNAAVDWAEATFAGPYQGNPGKGLAHRRRLLLFKRAAGLSPFLVVVDRFSCADAKSHAYEQLWHLKGAEFAGFSARSFVADYGRGVRLAGAHSDPDAKFVDKRGQTEPELQGWDPGNWDKHNAKPIATPVVCGTFAENRRVVTVLQPLRASDAARRITSVEASPDPSARDFVLTLGDGGEASPGRRRGCREKA